MTGFLFAGKDEDYVHSAYAFVVAGGRVYTDIRMGWTVQEAYLNGLRDMSNHIIQKNLWEHDPAVELVTPSKMIVTLVTTDKLQKLHDNNWKNPDGKPLFHVPILQELYWHRLYYLERDVIWKAASEVAENEYFRVEQCREVIDSLVNS